MKDQPKIQPDGTLDCPTCKRIHAAFYYTDNHGGRSLCYICDQVPHYNHNGNLQDKHGLSLDKVTRTERRTIEPFVDGLPLREEWSRGWKQKQQDKAELQFPLMTHGNKKPTP
jgi:hypothetical protein